MRKPNRITKSYRLQPQTIQQIDTLAKAMTINNTDIIEIAVQNYYDAMAYRLQPQTLQQLEELAEVMGLDNTPIY